MEPMALWEKILLGVLVVLVLLWFRPGIKTMFKERRKASQQEWLSVLIPIALVAAFVAVLIMLT
jgi:di/tricarboxylate transporter